MSSLKLHLINKIQDNLKQDSRLLILGPLEISKKTINKSIKEISPSKIILIDGGLNHKLLLPKKVSTILLSVGDGDSYEGDCPLDINLPKKKDYSDLSFVVEAIIKSKINYEKITFLGFSSKESEKRLDHFLFNLGLIEKLATKLSIAIKMDEQFIMVPSGKNSFTHRGFFSIIALKPTEFRIAGKAKYQLTNWTKLPALNSLGLSNYANGSISIENKKTVIIYLAGTNSNS